MAPENPWESTAERVLELLRAGRAADAFAEIEAAEARLPPDRPAAGFHEVGRLLYWQHKALPEYLAVSRERIRRLEASLDADEPEMRGRLIAALGGTCYNTASYTWPGWDEPGIIIGPEELAMGREAAQRCLEIRTDPANAAAPFGYTVSMAHWAVGAQFLAMGALEPGRQHFTIARSEDLDSGRDHNLNAGYLALVDLLETPDAPAAEQAFQAALSHLEESKQPEAKSCRDQLLTARRVFEKRRNADAGLGNPRVR